MKAVFVLHSGNLNGIFRACFSFARYLVREKNAKVILFCPEYKQPLEQFKAIGVEIELFKSDEEAIQTLDAKSFKPNLILRESFFSPDFSKVAKYFSSRYLVRVHDLLPFYERTEGWYTKHLTADEYFKQCQGETLVFMGSSILDYYRPLIDQYLVQAHFSYPTIVEEEIEVSAPAHLDDLQTIRILQLGTVYSRKGCIQTLEAFADAKKKVTLPIELHFIGDRRSTPNEIEYSDRLKGIILKKGMGEIVKVWPSHPTPHTLLPHYDLLTLHSESECTPLVIFEAQYLGKPVVAASVGAVSEQVDSGKNGFLFRYGDIQAQSDAFVQIALNIEEWRAREKQIKLLYSSRFSADIQNKKLYEICLGKNG